MAHISSSEPTNDRPCHEMTEFFDATTDGIIFLDRSYNVTFMNRRGREMVSPDGSLVGKNLFESFPALLNKDSPYFENYRRTLELGEVRKFEAFHPEPLNIWLQVQSYPSQDGIMVSLRDFTREKQANDELRCKSEQAEREHAEIEAVYRTAPIGLCLLDANEFRYQRLNDQEAEFFGLKPDQLLGHRVVDVAPMQNLQQMLEEVRSGKQVTNYPLEGSLATDPENHRYWTLNCSPVTRPDGSVHSIAVAVMEVTAQKKAERALIQTEKLSIAGRMASAIAHEINNPLEAVSNLLFLARMSDDVEEKNQQLELADAELRRAAAISSRALRFHKQATSPQEVTAESLIESVLPVFQGNISRSGVQVNKRMRAQRPVQCFDGEIRQVLSNLIGNALDALDGRGRLLLRTRSGTNWKTGEKGVVMTIADNGTGMSGATIEKLYEPFFTTKGARGTGLGLWVAKEIIDRHRGALWVRSSQSRQCHGTTFALFLPFRAELR